MLWRLCSHKPSHENMFLKTTAYHPVPAELNVWVDGFYVIDEAVVDKVSIGRLFFKTYTDTVTNCILQNVVSDTTLSYILLLLY